MGSETSGSKAHVAKFLLDLTNDPEKRQHYDALQKMMDEAGLDEEDRAVCLSGDADKVRKHLGEDDPPGCLMVFPFA